jgi:hypothetical protein
VIAAIVIHHAPTPNPNPAGASEDRKPAMGATVASRSVAHHAPAIPAKACAARSNFPIHTFPPSVAGRMSFLCISSATGGGRQGEVRESLRAGGSFSHRFDRSAGCAWNSALCKI